MVKEVAPTKPVTIPALDTSSNDNPPLVENSLENRDSGQVSTVSLDNRSPPRTLSMPSEEDLREVVLNTMQVINDAPQNRHLERDLKQSSPNILGLGLSTASKEEPTILDTISSDTPDTPRPRINRDRDHAHCMRVIVDARLSGNFKDGELDEDFVRNKLELALGPGEPFFSSRFGELERNIHAMYNQIEKRWDPFDPKRDKIDLDLEKEYPPLFIEDYFVDRNPEPEVINVPKSKRPPGSVEIPVSEGRMCSLEYLDKKLRDKGLPPVMELIAESDSSKLKQAYSKELANTYPKVPWTERYPDSGSRLPDNEKVKLLQELIDERVLSQKGDPRLTRHPARIEITFLRGTYQAYVNELDRKKAFNEFLGKYGYESIDTFPKIVQKAITGNDVDKETSCQHKVISRLCA